MKELKRSKVMHELFSHSCPFMKRLIDVVFGILIGVLLGADILFARSIDMSKAGVSLWIFVVVGAFIILLQLIPAFILFTTFISGMPFTKK
jgi:uncharacterized membrane protein YhiD involved in acid resistance